MRTSSFVPTLVFAFASIALGFACSGKGATADIGLDAATPSDAGNGAFPLPVPDGAFTEPDAARVDAGERVYDAGERVTLEGGVACVAGGVLEQEPNDLPGQPNELAPTVCGVVSPGSESDFLTFQLKASTKHMYVGYDGNVKLTVQVGDQVVVLAPGSAPSVPFVRGKKYTVEVQSVDGARQPWRVTLFEFDR